MNPIKYFLSLFKKDPVICECGAEMVWYVNEYSCACGNNRSDYQSEFRIAWSKANGGKDFNQYQKEQGKGII